MLATLAIALAVATTTPTDRKQPSADDLVERGWLELHDLDYDAAADSFRAIQRIAPDDPRGFLYEAVTVWMRELERRRELDVSSFIDARHFAEEDGRPPDAKAETRLLRLVEHAMGRARARLATNPDDLDARYLLGTSHAVLAGFETTVRHRVKPALEAAKLAVYEIREVVATDPDYADAYLALGMYEYTTGSLPFYLKWIAFFAGYRGDKAKGVEMMERAAAEGRTARRDAAVLLAVVYVREQRYEDAVELLDRLTADAPHNHLLRLNAGWVRFRLGRYFEAADSYSDALRVARRHARIDRAAVRLLEGRALLYGGAAAQALARANETLADVGLETRLHDRARLLAARSLDVLERRAEAVQHYLRVVRSDDPDRRLRRDALEGLKNPFAPPGVAPEARADAGRSK